jgi:hypothetical protein
VEDTTYARGSDKATRVFGTWALPNAVTDADQRPPDVPDTLAYAKNDSTSATFIGGDVAIRLNL